MKLKTLCFLFRLKGAPIEPGNENEPVVLTKKRKTKIAQFLRETLKNPLKYAEFMSKEWVGQLIGFLDLFNERTIEATSTLVAEVWLKDSSFQKVSNFCSFIHVNYEWYDFCYLEMQLNMYV